jgi:hypothetical protein
LRAATNPKVSWALSDPAPLPVVVRRADAAEETAKHVQRLLVATPLDDSAEWVGKTAPNQEGAQKKAQEIAARDEYAASGARVIPAEVWRTTLAGLSPPLPALTSAEVASVPSSKMGQGSAKRTRVEAAATKKVAAIPPPASASPKYATLLAAFDASLGDKGAQVLAKRRQIGELEAQIELAKEDKNKKEELEKRAEAARADAKKLEQELTLAATLAGARASAEVRALCGPAFVNLRQAVEDASVANGAAALRYPLTAPALLQSAEQMAHVFAADVIEEKTGKRPDTRGLQPGVTLEGGKVQVTINGLSPSELGRLSVAEVTAATAERTQRWVDHAVGLLGTIAATNQVLEVEADLLNALVGGLERAGWKGPPPPTLPTITPKRPERSRS